MTRSVVFKTPGKLDLRSLTKFGLNSKPNTKMPIGFFGTGMKYAIAILAREKIPVTIYIDGAKWTIQVDDTNFRGKEFKSLSLVRNRKTLGLGKTIELPFTTELGKTWALWQAFRELESNTRDENGETGIRHNFEDIANFPAYLKGSTVIIVESEAFVQEFLDKDKTFLPGGLTQREGTEDVQVFDRPSKCIYYRSIRVLDLADGEASELTYNILRPMELTEDRTLKSKWDAEYHIANAIAVKKDPVILKKVVAAPSKTFESGLNFYAAPSREFLDAVEETPVSERTLYANATHSQYRPPKVKAQDDSDWFEELIQAITTKEDSDHTLAIIYAHKPEVIEALKAAQLLWQKEKTSNEQAQIYGASAGLEIITYVKGSKDDPAYSNEEAVKTDEDDSIPF